MCVCTVSPVNGVGPLHSDNTLGFRIGTYRRELLVVDSLSGSCAPVAHVCTCTHPSHPLTPNMPSHTHHTVTSPLCTQSPHPLTSPLTPSPPLTHHHIPSVLTFPSHAEADLSVVPPYSCLHVPEKVKEIVRVSCPH